jgi:hypothetical protein
MCRDVSRPFTRTIIDNSTAQCVFTVVSEPLELLTQPDWDWTPFYLHDPYTYLTDGFVSKGQTG